MSTLPEAGGAPPSGMELELEETTLVTERPPSGGGLAAGSLADALVKVYQAGGLILAFLFIGVLLILSPALFQQAQVVDPGPFAYLPWVGSVLVLACFTLFAAAFVTGRRLEKAKGEELKQTREALDATVLWLTRERGRDPMVHLPRRQEHLELDPELEPEPEPETTDQLPRVR